MSKYDLLLDAPESLHALLMVADAADLCVLADYITDKGDGRLTLDSDIRKRLHACRTHELFTKEDRQVISDELLLFGGNSIANAFRSVFGSKSAVTYQEIAKDVASKLKVAYADNASVLELESAILMSIFKKGLDSMSDSERDAALKEVGVSSMAALRPAGTGALAGASAALSLNIASTVAPAVAVNLLGAAAITGGMFVGSRAIAAVAGPVGIAVATLWTVADLASPAFRITMPCVVQLAYMRQKYLSVALANNCPKCSSDNLPDAKFCNNCGHKMS